MLFIFPIRIILSISEFIIQTVIMGVINILVIVIVNIIIY